MTVLILFFVVIVIPMKGFVTSHCFDNDIYSFVAVPIRLQIKSPSHFTNDDETSVTSGQTNRRRKGKRIVGTYTMERQWNMRWKIWNPPNLDLPWGGVEKKGKVKNPKAEFNHNEVWDSY